jgi:hypothetical protein
MALDRTVAPAIVLIFFARCRHHRRVFSCPLVSKFLCAPNGTTGQHRCLETIKMPDSNPQTYSARTPAALADLVEEHDLEVIAQLHKEEQKRSASRWTFRHLIA